MSKPKAQPKDARVACEIPTDCEDDFAALAERLGGKAPALKAAIRYVVAGFRSGELVQFNGELLEKEKVLEALGQKAA